MALTYPLASPVDLLDLHRHAPSRYPLLLESSAAGTVQGRWDVLLAGNGESLQLDPDGLVRDQRGVVVGDDFLQALDNAWQAERVEPERTGWPFRGGWALLLGYELAVQIEPVLKLPPAPGGLPVAVAIRCPAAILRDHVTGDCFALAEPEYGGLLEAVAVDLASLARQAPLCAWQPPSSIREDPPQRYLDGVARVLDYLVAGDVFQANVSRGWCAYFDAPVDPAALFQRLRNNNPAPFAGIFSGAGVGADADAGATSCGGAGDWSVVSASPERLVSVRGGMVETRPIAGTSARVMGDDDSARISELIAHPKERAEHVMLIDLERNDLGRVCVPGSVEVDELMVVESYAHVHHIVSNVRGRLRETVTPGEVIRAVFPGGTITGCPKVRCMQVIAELEGQGRGSYTGAMGWLNRDGDLDLNILIRSAEIEMDTLRFRTGAGIVVDSDPQRELDETRAKARGMLRALGCGDGDYRGGVRQ
ncbi:aminodeoxychorismate synthase component I [Lysobacter sp. A421]